MTDLIKRPTGRLAGRVAIVTGAASGMGRAVSLLFAREGAIVAAFDRSLEECEETAAMVSAKGGTSEAFEVDVSNAANVDDAVAKAHKKWGRIDILVNCAGIVGGGFSGDISDADWRRNIEINLFGTMSCCRAAITYMRRQNSGSIVNIGSISGIIPGQNRSAYGASKAGVHSLTRSIATEYGKEGLRANAIAPGPIATPLTKDLFAQDGFKVVLNRLPLGRPGLPEEIAMAALFLASDESSFITGQTIAADGGLTIT